MVCRYYAKIHSFDATRAGPQAGPPLPRNGAHTTLCAMNILY